MSLSPAYSCARESWRPRTGHRRRVPQSAVGQRRPWPPAERDRANSSRANRRGRWRPRRAQPARRPPAVRWCWADLVRSFEGSAIAAGRAARARAADRAHAGRRTRGGRFARGLSPRATAALAAALPLTGKATNTYGSGPLTRFWNAVGGPQGETPLDVPGNEVTATRCTVAAIT